MGSKKFFSSHLQLASILARSKSLSIMSSGNVLLSLFKNHNMMMAAANDHVYDAPISYKRSTSCPDLTVTIQTEIKSLDSGKSNTMIKEHRGIKGMENRGIKGMKTKYIKS